MQTLTPDLQSTDVTKPRIHEGREAPVKGPSLAHAHHPSPQQHHQVGIIPARGDACAQSYNLSLG